ncbi:MotA/TolQ/ExbB proton channel family protein [Methanosphaera sp.]
MATTIPGGEILSGILNVVSQSLLLPVMILLIIFLIFAVIELGSIVAEYTGRRTITAQEKEIIIKNIASCETQDQICQVVNHTKFTKNDKDLLCSVAKLDTELYDKETREILARNLLEDQEFKIAKSLEKLDIIAKIGSGCGLLGTIIPMGPGLAALGSGDMTTLTSNLTVAFNTTTAGLASGSLCFVISAIRSRWYEEDVATLYDLAEVILEVI